MLRPLRYLVRAETYIAQQINLGHCLKTSGIKPSVLFINKEKEKPQKINKLMVLMIHTQQDRCVLCGEALIIDYGLPSDHPDRPSFDHVVCRARGGQDRGNRIAAHRQCNSIKADRDPTGCELIWLMVVNLAIDEHEYLFDNKRKNR